MGAQQDKKQELLDAALRLFSVKGYEKTSVHDIMEKVKISKGGFYYYFKSKEEILEMLVKKEVDRLVTIIEEIAEDTKLNALEKFNKLIAEAQGYKKEHTKNHLKMAKIFQGYENLKLQHRLEALTEKKMKPLLQKIFKQGVKEKIFKTQFPEEIGEAYMYLMTGFQKTMHHLFSELPRNPQNIKLVKHKLDFFEDTLERMLGLKKGSIKISRPVMNYLTKLIKQL